MEGAQQLLQQLYAKDQYYGDPLGLGKKVKVRVPPTYQQEQAQPEKEEARRDWQDEAEARQKAHLAFVKEAYGDQWGKLWLTSIVWFVFVSNVGATISAITQSWSWALIAMLIVATGSWGLGYHRVLARLPLAVVFAVSLVLTLGLTLSLARLDYAHPYPSLYSTFDFHAGKNVIQYHYLFLRRQLNFGLIWWAVTSFVGVAITFFLKPPIQQASKRRELILCVSWWRPSPVLFFPQVGTGEIALLVYRQPGLDHAWHSNDRARFVGMGSPRCRRSGRWVQHL